MSVITISGQVGSGDNRLARSVAEKLGYLLVDRAVYEEVLKEYGIVDFDQLLDTPMHFLDRFAGEKRDTADLLNKMYLLFAKRNNIVLHSRRAFLVLSPFINVVNVFLKAPLSFRVQNLMESEKIGERSAEERIRREEKNRERIIDSFYKKRWDSIEPWTLVINTHKLGIDLAEKMILDANARVSECDEVCGWQDGFPGLDTIEADPILGKAVKKVLPEF